MFLLKANNQVPLSKKITKIRRQSSAGAYQELVSIPLQTTTGSSTSYYTNSPQSLSFAFEQRTATTTATIDQSRQTDATVVTPLNPITVSYPIETASVKQQSYLPDNKNWCTQCSCHTQQVADIHQKIDMIATKLQNIEESMAKDIKTILSLVQCKVKFQNGDSICKL